MSTDNILWMGNIEPWMTESFIMKSFNYYNITPANIKLIKDRETNLIKNYCFVYFNNVKEASNILIKLNGKLIPGTSIKFKLNWANYYSTFNKSIYVGNLSRDVDDISLYNLFKKKYDSVHHASVITNKGKSRGFGFVLFRGEKDFEKCLKEMDGIEFHGNIIKVSEQMKKEDNDSNNNDDNNYNEIQNNYMINNLNNIINDNVNINTVLNKINLQQNISNKGINSINATIDNSYMDPNLGSINSNNLNTNTLNSINTGNVNINNPIIQGGNTLNNIRNLNDIHIANYLLTNNNNLSYIPENNNFNNNIIKNVQNQNINLNNFMTLYPKNENILQNNNNNNNNFIQNDVNNNNFLTDSTNNLSNKNLIKKTSSKNYKLEILNKYDDATIIEKIRKSLNKSYNYYINNYPGDISKLKCKLNKLINFSNIVSNMYIYYCQSAIQLKILTNNDNHFLIE